MHRFEVFIKKEITKQRKEKIKQKKNIETFIRYPTTIKRNSNGL